MKFSIRGNRSKTTPEVRELRQMIQHWEAMALEAEQQGEATQQNPLFVRHAYGLSDGLKLAAGELRKQIEAVENVSLE